MFNVKCLVKSSVIRETRFRGAHNRLFSLFILHNKIVFNDFNKHVVVSFAIVV